MHAINLIYTWFDLILWVGVMALHVWSIADCATRKGAAFPAVDRLTKAAWLGIVVVAGVVGVLFSPLNVISLIATVAAAVYLADVRPAVREITGGSRGW